MKLLFFSQLSKFNVLMTFCALGITGFTGTVAAVPQEVCVKTSVGNIVCGTLVPKPQSVIPQVISSCETSEYGTFCGKWTWNGKYFDALWDNGAKAKLMVERFDTNSIILTREDDSGVSLGLSARYEGKPNVNQIQKGVVTGTWHWNTGRTQTKTWTWNAKW
jgi:hypothetical protein